MHDLLLSAQTVVLEVRRARNIQKSLCTNMVCVWFIPRDIQWWRQRKVEEQGGGGKKKRKETISLLTKHKQVPYLHIKINDTTREVKRINNIPIQIQKDDAEWKMIAKSIR